MFKSYYYRRFREILGEPLRGTDGLGDEALRRCGLTLPRALAEYYSVAGRHPINVEHNRLLPPERLDWIDDKLHFMEENQNVVLWGIARDDLSEDNPIVWQGVNGDSVEWYPEPYRLAQFLMATWNWTRTGLEGEPEG